MYSDDYRSEDDDCDDGRQQLEEYEMYVREIQRKATALLTIPDALVLAGRIAENLAGLVQQHSVPRFGTNLTDALRNSLCEDVFFNAMEQSNRLLQQPFSRTGYIAISKSLDDACSAFEALLAAEERLLPVESGAK